MKQLKHFALLGALLFSFIACNEEYDEVQTTQSNEHHHYKIETKTFEELSKDSKFTTAFVKLPKQQKQNATANLSKTVMEVDYGFTIADVPAKVMSDDEITSYTFLIYRDSVSDVFFENLVVQTDTTNTTKAVIVKYNLNSPVTYSEAHHSYYIDAEKEVTPIVYNDTPVDGKVLSISFTGDCMTIVETLCNNDGSGHVGGTHSAGDECTNASFIWTQATTICGLGGASGGTFGGDGGNPGGYGVPGGSGGSGGGGNHSNNVVTTPVFELKLTPCEIIKDKTSTPEYKQKFKALNTPANYNLNHETGYGLVNGNYVDFQPHPVNHSVIIPPGAENGTHIHNNIPKVNEAGQPYDASIKMLSIGDLVALINNLQFSNSSPENAYVVMASNEGIFAITILEPIAWTPELMQKLVKFNDYYKMMAKDMLQDYADMTALQRKKYLEKMFLKGLSKYGLGNSIGLFEGEVENENDPDINNYTINWTRKTGKKVFFGIGFSVIETPCNN